MLSIRRLALTVLVGLAVIGGGAAASARAADYVPGEVIVGYKPVPAATVAKAFTRRMGIRAAAPAPSVGTQVLRLPKGLTVAKALGRLRHQAGVAYAVPNYIAHTAGAWVPNDPGRAKVSGGWERMQWNFLPGSGVDAPWAWANLLADHRPGGRGVKIAVLDTGVAYRDWQKFKKAPDFANTRFVDPYDFVAHNRFPLELRQFEVRRG